MLLTCFIVGPFYNKKDILTIYICLHLDRSGSEDYVCVFFVWFTFEIESDVI